jgi:hypothetical protein
MVDPEVYLGFAGVLSFFSVFIAICFFSNKKKVAALTTLAGVFRGRVTSAFIQPALEADYQGLKFSIVLRPQSKNSPSYLNITLFKNTYFKVSVYKESFLSALGKKLGLVHEVKINDEMFDREFLMFSDRPEQMAGYFNREDVKNAIRELFYHGFNVLLIDGKKVFSKKPNYTLENDLQPDYIKDILNKLNLLTK